MIDDAHLFATVLSALGVLHLLVTGAALILCWPHRGISPGMNLVLGGLLGMMLSGIVGCCVPMVLSPASWFDRAGLIVTTLVGLMSWGLVVIGLAITFNDVRRAISLVKDRRHDLE